MIFSKRIATELLQGRSFYLRIVELITPGAFVVHYRFIYVRVLIALRFHLNIVKLERHEIKLSYLPMIFVL